MAEPDTRVGWGFDAHRFGPGNRVVLCGVAVEHDRGVEATSDGDVATHALIDALLGAIALGDLGRYFDSDHPSMQGVSSMELLARALRLVEDQGYGVGNVDVTVVSESVRVAPQREEMRVSLASALGIDVATVSVKATSTDGMGAIGADEGIAATAMVLVYR
jgi:2-C-methyl-D-erythritol 2,4-cyclodiphosphate synthase